MKVNLQEFLNEKYGDKVKIEIECTESAADSILPILVHMKFNGDIGHSYSIIADPDRTKKEGGYKNFGFDGDGSDHIISIKLNGKEYKKK